jgi:hypothetical protein
MLSELELSYASVRGQDFKRSTRTISSMRFGFVSLLVAAIAAVAASNTGQTADALASS